MNNTGWKKALKVFVRILVIVVIILAVAVVSLAGTFFYIRWHKDVQDKPSGDLNFLEQMMVSEKKEEPVVTCLFLGLNGNLTDFIMLGQYDPNTREIDLLSIPRDTNIGNNSVDGKLNSCYSTYKKKSDPDYGFEKVKEQITEITGIEIDYYVMFKTKILRQLVDEIGGVTVNVPINMNYDDPYQNLYIHLKKGTQKLTGSQAEQFVRFRKNNDGTGYPGGDVDRTKAQQQFITAFISELLKAENISKIPELISIVLDGTTTDVTLDVAKGYIDDVIAIRTDKISTNTIPGEGRNAQSPLGYVTSYYFIDDAEAEKMISEMFHNKAVESGDALKTVLSTSVITKDSSGEEKVRVELLNAGTTSKIINDLVAELKEQNFYVVKIGNYETTSKEASRIIDHGYGSEVTLNKLKDTIGVTKTEVGSDESTVAYTIIVGPYYE